MDSIKLNLLALATKLRRLRHPIVDPIMIMITMDRHLVTLDTVIVITHRTLGMYFNTYTINIYIYICLFFLAEFSIAFSMR